MKGKVFFVFYTLPDALMYRKVRQFPNHSSTKTLSMLLQMTQKEHESWVALTESIPKEVWFLGRLLLPYPMFGLCCEHNQWGFAEQLTTDRACLDMWSPEQAGPHASSPSAASPSPEESENLGFCAQLHLLPSVQPQSCSASQG